MFVWEKIAYKCSTVGGKVVDLDYIYNWLQKFGIKACELESNVGYLGISIQCDKRCSTCLLSYLSTEIGKSPSKNSLSEDTEFKVVIDEFGQEQFKLF